MNDTEAQAYELLRQREWCGAAELFDQLLGPAFQKGTPKERIVGYLLGRSECLLELGRHEAVVSDCRRVIKLLADVNASNSESRAWKRLVHALFYLQRFAEAEAATQEWLAVGGGAANQPDAVKMLERLRIVFQVTNGQHKLHTNHCNPVLEDEILALDSRLESWTGISPQRQRKHPVELLGEATDEPDSKVVHVRRKLMLEPISSSHQLPEAFLTQKEVGVGLGLTQNPMEASRELVCTYCCLKFNDRSDLRSHCQSEGHQTVIMSDEGRDWQWRPPPRGLRSDAYVLCDAWAEIGSCRYGNQCVDAHGAQELSEWRERFEYRRMKLQRACEKELFGKSYTEQLLERWVTAASPEKVLRENVDGVEDSCSAELVTTVANKRSTNEWTFTLRTDQPLKTVALLQDATRNHFFLRHVTSKEVSSGTFCEWVPGNDQEWSVPMVAAFTTAEPTCLEHTVKVFFTTDIYGTFRQSVVFDLGHDPILVRHLCVDVVPLDHVDKMKEIVKELTLCALERWDHRNAHIAPYVAPVVPGGVQTAGVAAEGERHSSLLNAYPSPRADTFAITQSTIQEKRLTRNNYRARMHELLAVEEMARYEQVARYNMTTNLRLATCYLLAPNGMATSTAKYAQNGELFALMTLGKDVSEDTCEGRLILNNCTTVLLAAAKTTKPTNQKKTPNKKNSHHQAESLTDVNAETGKRIVHEALIEDKGKNMIYLRLSAATVKLYKMKTDTDFSAEIQFQLNRIPYCEWHYAIDKIADFRVIFPDTYLEPSIPWTPKRQWNETLDSRLNLKQKEAVVAITTPMGVPLPPILIIGPFGTGKTYTLAQAIKQLLLQSDTKVLVCTHSNSAADLYIKDYLHPYVESGHEEARPLRIYYHKRWVATVNQTVQKYCLIEMVGGARTFRIPTLEDIRKHRIVVVTLSISMYLATLGLNKGHFSHILLDEAAQAMECEAIMPLALATEDTRIVLAGDHMQLSPELFSQFAKERNLHVSLLERLYDHYPQSFPCKVLLCENYRAHEAIIQFTSELFYDQKLISSGKQPRHDKFYPLTFFTTRGEDVQDINSTAFYNNSEVYEVVERVSELRKKWPSAWGKMDDQSIGIMTPYADQVFRIRSELRKRRMGGISVERVLNVQGKQFRAIFLSTVRTRRTCSSGTKAASGGEEMDYGFLSNSKLLNTAITRAQSLVAVVGDPVALCSIGRCRKVWERFIEICNNNKSLFGITWSSLRSQLDGVELKKTYTLNPLAPEFVPRAAYQEPYIRLPSILGPVPPQLPPFNPQISPYVYRYPLYYYPPQYPLRPPNPPLLFPPTPPPPLNPWAVNYPMASPPGTQARNTPFKKKGDPARRPDNATLDLGLWGAGRATTNQSPQDEDSYVPGGVFNPANACRGPGFIGPLVREQNDRDQIQFLHNVHFPEGQPDMPDLRTDFSGLGPVLPGLRPDLQDLTRLRMDLSTIRPDLPRFRPELPGLRPSLPTLRPDHPGMMGDHGGLLPNNVGLQEMVDSPPKQLEWYSHMLETQGPLAANKFMELLMLGSRKGGHSPEPHHSDMRPIKDVFPEKNTMFQALHMQPQMNQGDMCGDLSGSKPFLLCDVEASLLHGQAGSREVGPGSFGSRDSVHSRGHFRPQDLQQGQINNGETSQGHLGMFQGSQLGTDESLLQGSEKLPNHLLGPPGPWDLLQGPPGPRETWPPPQQQNVPLYRRQPAEVKTTSGNSGAFAGYARAAVSNGLPNVDNQHAQEAPYFNQMNLLQVSSNQFDQQQSNLNQQMMTQHVNAEFSSDLEGHTTYASVLRAQPGKPDVPDGEEKGDPFAVLRALGTRRDTQSTNGLYQYFF